MSGDPMDGMKPIPSRLVQSDESFAELVEEFVDGLAERLAQLAQAMGDNDFARLRTLAHQLKGSAGGYGYPELTDKAAELERGASAEDFATVQQKMNDLTGLVARVVIRVEK